jgi:hypothetical protein
LVLLWSHFFIDYFWEQYKRHFKLSPKLLQIWMP